MKLCLGTVQFGMDYGILNRKKPSMEDAIACLDYATQNGISAIDTARAYGTAEYIVGEFLKRHTIPRDHLFISTKFKPNLLDGYEPEQYKKVVVDQLKEQLLILNTDYIDAYLFHTPELAYNEAALEAIYSVQKIGLAKKVGVSVYNPEEAVACFNSRYVSFIQVPYSIFDHRMKEKGIFEKKVCNDCEIHTRSAFIQGLITLDVNNIPPFLIKAKPIIKKIDYICKSENLSRVELAMAYVRREEAVSHLVFGIDSKSQLEEDIRSFNKELPKDLLDHMDKEFEGIEADIVIPSLWRR